MADDIYARLRKHLEDYVLGAPEADSIIDILRIRFTPEEAEVALNLGQAHKELSVVAEKAGTQLRTIKEFNVAPDRAMARSRFEAQLDPEKCVSCGV